MVATTSTTASTAGSVLANLADDAYLRLVRVLVNEEKFYEQCTACIEAETESAPLLPLLLNNPSVLQRITELCNSANDDDDSIETASGVLALLAGLFVQQPSSDSKSQQQLMTMLLDAITTSSSNNKNKMQLLTVLYNIVPEPTETKDSSLKCTVLVRLLESSNTIELTPTSPLGRWIMGTSTNTTTSSLPPLTKIVAAWPSSDRCRVYETVCAVLLQQGGATNKEHATIRQQFLLLLLAEHPTDTNIAEQVVIGAMQHPVTLFAPSPHRHLLLAQSPTLQALRTSTPTLVQLLEFFVKGHWGTDYQSFVKQHATTMQDTWGLDLSQCERNLRLLSLCSIASSSSSAIPYATIRDTLQLPSDDTNTSNVVEALVVEAVQQGLWVAKLDPVAQTVLVEQCVVRHFDTEQWRHVQERLRVWKERVGNVLATLQQETSSVGQ